MAISEVWQNTHQSSAVNPVFVVQLKACRCCFSRLIAIFACHSHTYFFCCYCRGVTPLPAGTAAELGKVRAELAGAENRAALALAAQASSHAESQRRIAELIEEAVTGGTFASASTLGGGGSGGSGGNGGRMGGESIGRNGLGGGGEHPPMMRQSYEFNRSSYDRSIHSGGGVDGNNNDWNEGSGVRDQEQQQQQRSNSSSGVGNSTSRPHGMTPAQLLAKVNMISILIILLHLVSREGALRKLIYCFVCFVGSVRWFSDY